VTDRTDPAAQHIGFFLKDLLSVMDRGQVFKFIYVYVTNLTPTNSDPNLISFKARSLEFADPCKRADHATVHSA
jgi:hypothetical protein